MGLSMEGFWRGIWNWEDGFWKRGLKKRKKKRRKEIGEFSFLETNLGLEGWYIYRWEKEKKKGGGLAEALEEKKRIRRIHIGCHKKRKKKKKG